MTEKQIKLFEQKVRKIVKEVLIESPISKGSTVTINQNDSADESFKQIAGKSGKVVGTFQNYFIVMVGKLKILLTQDEITPT